MLRFSVLASGSGGNAILVASAACKILIDGGLSLRQLRQRAAYVGERLDDIEAVFVTHEHSDHVSGLGVLARQLSKPVFMTHGTAENLPVSIGEVPGIERFEAGDELAMNGMVVRSFSLSHDAADPVGYVVEAEGVRLGLAADMGYPSQLVRNRLSGVHGLVLESNHCPEMLRQGPYPPALQQRILGRQGHLSNAAMSALLAELAHERLRVVVLAHISAENNDPDLAYRMAAQAVEGHDVKVHVARQDEPTPLFELCP